MQVVKLSSEYPQISITQNNTQLSDTNGNITHDLTNERISLECLSGVSYPSSNLALFIGQNKLTPHNSICYREESMFENGNGLHISLIKFYP